jgi:hypothetical protein
VKDNYISKELKKCFPNITYLNSRATSAKNDDYNCIAWALEISNNWFWPSGGNDTSTLIIGLPRILNKTAFVRLFEYFGYRIIPDKNNSLESYTQKIAIYVDSFGRPTHAARQLRNGKWTSKLGRSIDIEHDTPEVLEGPMYGLADIIMGKRITVR